MNEAKEIELEGTKYIIKKWTWGQVSKIMTNAGTAPESFFIDALFFGLKSPSLSREAVSKLPADVGSELFEKILDLNNIEKLMKGITKLGKQLSDKIKPPKNLGYVT